MAPETLLKYKKSVLSALAISSWLTYNQNRRDKQIQDWIYQADTDGYQQSKRLANRKYLVLRPSDSLSFFNKRIYNDVLEKILGVSCIDYKVLEIDLTKGYEFLLNNCKNEHYTNILTIGDKSFAHEMISKLSNHNQEYSFAHLECYDGWKDFIFPFATGALRSLSHIHEVIFGEYPQIHPIKIQANMDMKPFTGTAYFNLSTSRFSNLKEAHKRFLPVRLWNYAVLNAKSFYDVDQDDLAVENSSIDRIVGSGTSLVTRNQNVNQNSIQYRVDVLRKRNILLNHDSYWIDPECTASFNSEGDVMISIDDGIPFNARNLKFSFSKTPIHLMYFE